MIADHINRALLAFLLDLCSSKERKMRQFGYDYQLPDMQYKTVQELVTQPELVLTNQSKKVILVFEGKTGIHMKKDQFIRELDLDPTEVGFPANTRVELIVCCSQQNRDRIIGRIEKWGLERTSIWELDLNERLYQKIWGDPHLDLELEQAVRNGLPVSEHFPSHLIPVRYTDPSEFIAWRLFEILNRKAIWSFYLGKKEYLFSVEDAKQALMVGIPDKKLLAAIRIGERAKLCQKIKQDQYILQVKSHPKSLSAYQERLNQLFRDVDAILKTKSERLDRFLYP